MINFKVEQFDKALDMGNNFKLYIWRENNKIIEVEIAYKSIYVGSKLTLEAAEHYVNSMTPESLASLEQEIFGITNPHPIEWN